MGWLRKTMNLFLIAILLCSSGVATAETTAQVSAAKDAAPKARSFEFFYKASLQGFEDGQTPEVVRVWIPLAVSTDVQRVEVLNQSSNKSVFRQTKEAKYGNRMLYGEFSGQELGQNDLDISIQYRVKRNEVRADQKTKPLKPDNLSVFLTANERVPLTGKPLKLLPKFGLTKSVTNRARQIYDQVDALVKYDKSKPGYGNGDVLWVCDSRTGNCTDFHSLFISMARSQSIPAKFEIGFPIPAAASGKIGGYHCWAAFFDQNRWIPVDISEADKHPEMKEYYFGNLTADRVQFSTGRDIVLEPPQQGAPLNYFIYPYAEVDGKPVAREQIKLDFSYRDLDE